MKEKRLYYEGLRTAEKLKRILAPYCERIEIAGSIRRRCPTVGDIELVAIPKKRFTENLFGPVEMRLTQLDVFLDEHPVDFPQVRSGERLKELRFEGFQVDLFLADEERWGVTFTLRTGSADFSKWLVSSRNDGGARRQDRYVKNCRVYQVRDPKPLDTPHEIDVFNALGVPWVPPELRVKGYWGTDMSVWRVDDIDRFVSTAVTDGPTSHDVGTALMDPDGPQLEVDHV